MRTSNISRKTKETDINLKLNLDGTGNYEITTGIGFFDHMLTALCVHAGLDLSVSCDGDLHVDGHHTVEDVGIVLGQALKKAIGDKSGINRYGSAFVPMDEALGFCSLDISGRAYLVFNADFKSPMIGGFDTSLTEEFFRAVAFNSGITLHIKCEYGTNDHHKVEAMFKAFAHALKQAKAINGSEVLSTKGSL